MRFLFQRLGFFVLTLWAAITVNFARKEELRRGLAFAAGLGVLALGAYDVANGFGLFVGA